MRRGFWRVLKEDKKIRLMKILEDIKQSMIVQINEEQIVYDGLEVNYSQTGAWEDNLGYHIQYDVTVKNKADKQYTYFITIEAIDSNGARIETDTVYADRLGSGQEIYLKVFEYIDQEKLDQFESASFRVLEINKYSS